MVERLLVVHHVFLNLSSAANDTIPRKYADAVKSFTRHYAVRERRARQDGTDVVFEAAEGTEVYRLSAPYMTDAAGAVSRGLTLTLTDDGGKKNGVWQQYLYDGSGQLMAIRYKGADYYYVRNGLMTITGLVDANGTAVVNYFYDSWGRMLNITGSLSASLGKDNPYRFKGYYYDEETGMYYLKSRYYQPEICRFISADDENVLNIEQGNLNQFNLYLYCLNNSVNRVDETGNISVSALLRGLGNAFTGFSAIGIGATVIACGVATPVMLGIAVATVAVGVLTTVNGASDLGEAFAGKNVVKDVVFNGNTKKYNTYSAAVATAATIGTIVCGGWVAKNIPRIKAYNNVQNYKYTKTISDAKHMRRVYNNSTLIQKQIIKYGKMQKDSFGYVFSVKGNVNGRTAVWRLGINVKRKMVWHFGHGF